MTKIWSIILQLDFINWQAILYWPPPLFFESLGFFSAVACGFLSCLTNSVRYASFIISLKFSKIFSPLNSLNSGALDGPLANQIELIENKWS